MAGFIETMFNGVDSKIDSYLFTAIDNLITHFVPIFSSLMIIWVVIWGYMTMFGYSQEPLKEGVSRIIKLGFILTLGLTATTYYNVVGNFLLEAPNEIGAIITGSTNYTAGGALDALYQKVFEAANEAWKQGGVMNGNFGMYILALIIALFGGGLVLTTIALVIISKTLLAVLVALGPIAISLILFKSTQRFFESWLGQCLNLGLVFVLATGVASLIVGVGDTFISRNNDPDLNDVMNIGLIFGLGIVVMKQVNAIASSLGGGIALATDGAVSERLSKMRPTNIKRNVNKARNDVSTAYNAARAPDRKAAAWAKSGNAAYQRKFGRGNSISGG